MNPIIHVPTFKIIAAATLDGPLTVKEIAKVTRLSEYTIRREIRENRESFETGRTFDGSGAICYIYRT